MEPYSEHRVLHGEVYNWCKASLMVPDLEPERRAQIEEIHTQANRRACSIIPHEYEQIRKNNALALKELAWLRSDPRVDIGNAY
ncbi:hypothetical protein [Methylobacterium gossipiicola]|uniref:Uncharacterized protein n=1 Tax=Methylobacterium gossipiicola TaxID=582675 RepID=A0A1I2V7F7_9HYPH|nr:hypothetical protein [Methylobacterium gossipiicola]SFG85315.1 hypothetical protein SAMN05192565_113120 [Methylobacterium gossipiicola]